MPRLLDNTMESSNVAGLQAFTFSAKRIEHLGATEYTLVTVAVDVTGSTAAFADKLREALVTAVASCKKSPRANNLLLRVILFSSSLTGGIEEIHGFKTLAEIKPTDYAQFNPYGSTNLYDASYSAIGATVAYSEKLMSQDFLANGIVIIITDGDDNSSSSTPKMVKDEMDRGKKAEIIESLIVLLVGINAASYKHRMDTFVNATGMKYIDVADATPGKLAKLAEFVSQSVSSQSQSLGTGGPSTAIALTI